MSVRLGVAVLALIAGCARHPASVVQSDETTRVLAILAAHRAADIELDSDWVRFDDNEAWFLHIVLLGDGRCAVRHEQGRMLGATPGGEPSGRWFKGTWADGVLTLGAPLDGSMRLHLCRFGEDAEAVLLPENAVRFDDPADPRPTGAVYQQVEMVSEPLILYGPGPEDEDRWWEDDGRGD